MDTLRDVYASLQQALRRLRWHVAKSRQERRAAARLRGRAVLEKLYAAARGTVRDPETPEVSGDPTASKVPSSPLREAARR
jgi:hypothetical protein